MGEKVEKVKKHFVDNKQFYIGVGVGVAITVTTVAIVVVTRKAPTEEGPIKIVNKIIGDHNTIITQIARRGHPGFVVKCNETGEVFASQRRAAEMLGFNPAALSEHFAGKRSDIKGMTFTKLGEAAS